MGFQSNTAIHPGRTINRFLDSLDMTQKNLSERTGVTEKHISCIVNGESSITSDMAVKLSNAIGGDPSFWNNLQTNYDQTLARLKNDELAATEVNYVKKFPYAELVKRGMVDKKTKSIDKVRELWKFFGVNSLSAVSTTEATAWRRGVVELDAKSESLAAWLRCGELEAKKLADSIDIAPHDAEKLKELLPKIRAYTTYTQGDFWSELQRDLAGVGVVLVAVRHFPGTKASGATRWMGDNPVIELSAYGRDADKVWFTLLHEIGHVLKHGKRDKFISFTKDNEKTAEELEADEFASETLIPKKRIDEFLLKGDFSRLSIIHFANEIQIHPGVVVGRLKNMHLLPYSVMQDMHSKLTVREV